MKQILFILIFLSTLLAEDLTVVGRSGSSYKVPYSVENGADVQKLLSSLYIGNTKVGDTLRVKSGSISLVIPLNDSIPKINGKVASFEVHLKKVDNRFWVSLEQLPKLLAAVSSNSYRYDKALNQISVEKSGGTATVAVPSKPVVAAVSKPLVSTKPAVTAVAKPAVATKPATVKTNGGVVVIDPGHGGKDPGAVGPTGLYEKTVVLAIARKTAKYIRDNSTMQVFLTREGDTFIPLRDRTEYANKRHADLFVSIHANASEKGDSVGGYKMYFLSDAKNATDERIAVFENAVMDLEESGDESDVLQSVLKDMINNEYLKESQELSADIEKAFRAEITTLKPLYTGVGQANFYVLNGAQMPSVLVETAFISNKAEEKLLRDELFLNKVAQALGKSIIAFRKKQGK